MPEPSPRAGRLGGGRAAVLRSALLGALLLTAVLLGALLAGCSQSREVLSSNAQEHRTVAIVSGREPTQPPADPAFRELSPLQLEASLRGLVVRPAHYFALNLGDPAPFLSPDQVTWARDALSTLLPKLRPDQRVELSFLDRFNHYDVVVDVYGEGRELVYRFSKLSAPEEAPTMTSAGAKPESYARLVPQPGQSYRFDTRAYYLKDAVLGHDAQARMLADKRAALEREGKERQLPADELQPARAVLEAHPELSLQSLRLYLDKLQLVLKAQQQGLFSADEAAQRKRKLLEELTSAAAAPAPAATPGPPTQPPAQPAPKS
jgi:hypothetical protein